MKKNLLLLLQYLKKESFMKYLYISLFLFCITRMLFRTLIDTVIQNNNMPAISHNIQNIQRAIVKLSTSIDSNEAKI